MRKTIIASVAVLSLFGTTALLGGCGSAKKEGQNDTAISRSNLANAAHLGDQNCQTCHGSSQDLTMRGSGDGRTIFTAWQNSLHHESVNGYMTVHCEDCHGGGQFHWGLGPLPHPNPQADVCLQCHGNTPPAGAVAALASRGQTFRNYTGYLSTAHANKDQLPDRFFFQGGTGTTQANYRGVPEVVVGTTTPVTVNQHIEQCSVCHSNNQRFISTSGTGTTGTTDTTGTLQANTFQNLSTPQVSCGSCHDAHQVGLLTPVPTRTTAYSFPLFRKQQVDANGANDPISGTWIAPAIAQPNGAVTAGGAPNMAAVVGTNNELHLETLCAACHTKGLYKYSRAQTHNDDVYTQWKVSGHAARNDAAWAEFSANPGAYTNPNTGAPYTDLGHQTFYPFDMAFSAGGATATVGRNAGVLNTRGTYDTNYLCFKCHNGIGSLSWQRNAQGTIQADVVSGDEPAICITCHDPHDNVSGQSANTRRPVVMTNYTSAAIKFVGNVFLDNQPIPDVSQTENATICIFCHQGRESGFTLYKNRLAPNITNATLNRAFFNPHYLGTAAMLWGHNGYEFTGQTYGVNRAHQRENCTGCHMDNPTANNEAGGHTWKPNVATCNTTTCHGSATLGAVATRTGTNEPDVRTYRAANDTNDYDGNGTPDPIAVEIQNLEQRVIALLAANGIFYDDLNYPYFFNVAFNPAAAEGAVGSHTTAGEQFTTWGNIPGGRDAYKAAFNLQFTIKGLPSGATSQANVPNSSAAVHNHIYIIQLLRDSYAAYNAVAGTPGAALGGVRPAGTRDAVVYGASQ